MAQTTCVKEIMWEMCQITVSSTLTKRKENVSEHKLRVRTDKVRTHSSETTGKEFTRDREKPYLRFNIP